MPSSVLEREVQFFAKIAGEDNWKPDHHKAMECLNLQDILELGIFLYDRICEADEKWRSRVAKKECAFNAEEASRLKLIFELWLKPCAVVESAIRACEADGYTVDGANDFRKRHAECVWALKPADKALDHPRMVGLRDAAIDHHRNGRTEPV